MSLWIHIIKHPEEAYASDSWQNLLFGDSESGDGKDFSYRMKVLIHAADA